MTYRRHARLQREKLDIIESWSSCIVTADANTKTTNAGRSARRHVARSGNTTSDRKDVLRRTVQHKSTGANLALAFAIVKYGLFGASKYVYWNFGRVHDAA